MFFLLAITRVKARFRDRFDPMAYGAGGGIRTHEPLRDGVLSPAPLTRLGDPRIVAPQADCEKLYWF